MKPTSRTLERIARLSNPATLDTLLDAFQEMGMPMGSDQWAEYCLTLLRQREEEAMALVTVMRCVNDAKAKRELANDAHWIEQRKRLTEDFQKRSVERDGNVRADDVVRRDGYHFCKKHRQEYQEYCSGCAIGFPEVKDEVS